MSFFLDILIILSTVHKDLFATVPCKQMPKKADHSISAGK
jgi:hypothetical protein